MSKHSVVCSLAPPPGGPQLAFKSNRPTYVIVLFALSILYMCVAFLPLFYSLLFPNEDIEQVVAALKEGGIAPLDADNVVQNVKTAVGSLTKAIQVGWGYTVTKKSHLSGAREHATFTKTECVYIAWFQKHPKPTLVSIALFANDVGQKAYQITEVSAVSVIRFYALPVLFFGVSLFLMGRKPPGKDNDRQTFRSRTVPKRFGQEM